jgi:hypothetical protein
VWRQIWKTFRRVLSSSVLRHDKETEMLIYCQKSNTSKWQHYMLVHSYTCVYLCTYTYIVHTHTHMHSFIHLLPHSLVFLLDAPNESLRRVRLTELCRLWRGCTRNQFLISWKNLWIQTACFGFCFYLKSFTAHSCFYLLVHWVEKSEYFVSVLVCISPSHIFYFFCHLIFFHLLFHFHLSRCISA